MIKYVALPFICLLMYVTSEAQVIIYRQLPNTIGAQKQISRGQRKLLSKKFEPTVNISIGYGFPNIDKKYLPAYYNTYYGTVSQKGPVTGSLDYQFSRRMSIGVLVTHGTIEAPYFDYFSSLPVFSTKLNNWGFMLNIVRYFPAGRKIVPYLRTAIGLNKWKQEYADPAGNKISMPEAEMPDFARQVALGAKFNLSKKAGLFIEAGYGKYIMQGGLAVKF